jgi:hypothetical protein
VTVLCFPDDVAVGVLDWLTLKLDDGPALAIGRVEVPDGQAISLDVWYVEEVLWTKVERRLSGSAAPVDLGFISQLPPSSIEALTLHRVVPASIFHLRHLAPGLRRLYLSNCELNDEALAHISDLVGLTYLQCYGNSFTDEGIRQLEALQELEYLYLEEETLSATGLEFVTRLPNLKRLGLMDLPLTAEQLATLRRALPSVDVG